MAIYLGSTEITPSILEGVSEIYLGSTLVWQAGLAAGTIFDFAYTGTVQSVELPKGKYKLQCWGAQGGSVTGTYAIAGSKGGYSEGILKLTSKTTLYVFVGGQGTSYTSSASQTSTTVVNGGWNGGGAGVRTAQYSSGDTDGRSFPRGGGGATDISTVTSDLSYSSGRTTRDSASLLARCIVAGGGAGASARYTIATITSSSDSDVLSMNGATTTSHTNYGSYRIFIYQYTTVGCSYSVNISSGSRYKFELWDANNTSYVDGILNSPLTASVSGTLRVLIFSPNVGDNVSGTLVESTTTTSTSTSSGISSAAQQGGGTSGKGQYPGTQSSYGTGGAFGLGASQSSTNYRYCAGGGGGGWYGGGTGNSDSSTSYINYSGGGSGFVNTAANASYRPSGYTGLELDSGTTTAGDSSFESTSGGTETGHSGNGYARITVLDEDGTVPETPSTTAISWDVQSGTWNSSSSSSSADGLSWTCVSPGTSGSTVIRCTFSGVTSITFNCVYNGESNYDYLTVGSLDTACTRSSYGTTLKGTSGTAKDITFTCDTGEHYVEFCYSKDGSVDTSPDNATVYVKSYS